MKHSARLRALERKVPPRRYDLPVFVRGETFRDDDGNYRPIAELEEYLKGRHVAPGAPEYVSFLDSPTPNDVAELPLRFVSESTSGPGSIEFV